METRRVTLTIKYDPTESADPAFWDWPTLLDLGDPDEVSVSAGPLFTESGKPVPFPGGVVR